MRTWKVRAWPSRTIMEDGEPVPLTCIHCETDAVVPTAGLPGSAIIAIIGMAIVFDHAGHKPPTGWLPDEIECRECGRIFSDEGFSGSTAAEGEHVRQAP